MALAIVEIVYLYVQLNVVVVILANLIVYLIVEFFFFFFFFSSRRRHTRYWRDWSSDVCSSDLTSVFFLGLWTVLRNAGLPYRLHWGKFQPTYEPGDRTWVDFFGAQYPRWDDFQIGRASCRERV